MIKFWLDGKLRSREKAVFNLELGAFHYGSVVFEGIMAVGIKEEGRRQIVLFRAPEHVDRLLCSAEIMGLTVEYPHREIIDAIRDTIISNGWHHYYVRPLIYGRESYLKLSHRNIPASLAILIRPFNFRVFSLMMRMPISLAVFDGLINPLRGNFSSLKISGRYLVNTIAKREACLSGYDDTVLLDQGGNVSETTAANIFAIKENRICTPHLDNILDGITRRTAIEILSTMGIGVQEKDVSREELLESDAVFISGTAVGIVSARRICHRMLDTRHKILVELQKRYLDIISAKDKKFKKYITYA